MSLCMSLSQQSVCDCNKRILYCIVCLILSDEDKLTGKIDLIICLGGDGTLLYASTLFQVNLSLSQHFSIYHRSFDHLCRRHIEAVFLPSSVCLFPSLCL